MTDDVLTRAKAEYAGFGEHFPNDLAADLIALAESQAAQLAAIRERSNGALKAERLLPRHTFEYGQAEMARSILAILDGNQP